MAVLSFLLSFIPLYYVIAITKFSIKSRDYIWVLAVLYLGGIGCVLFIMPILMWLKIIPFYDAP